MNDLQERLGFAGWTFIAHLDHARIAAADWDCPRYMGSRPVGSGDLCCSLYSVGENKIVAYVSARDTTGANRFVYHSSWGLLPPGTGRERAAALECIANWLAIATAHRVPDILGDFVGVDNAQES